MAHVLISVDDSDLHPALLADLKSLMALNPQMSRLLWEVNDWDDEVIVRLQDPVAMTEINGNGFDCNDALEILLVRCELSFALVMPEVPASA